MHVFTACSSVFIVLKPLDFLLFNQPTTALTITDKTHKSFSTNKAFLNTAYSKREYSFMANILKSVVPSHI